MESSMNRRLFLANMIFTSFAASACQAKPQKEIDTPFKLTDAEWKARLTPLQYNILRHEGTEAPFTSKLLDEHGKGVFACVGCDNPLFNSNTKFDSGTGWPSFYDEIKGALGKKSDMLIGELRTAYYCANCGGHHGHVFPDGPDPTGLRYCSNGAVLKFIPQKV